MKRTYHEQKRVKTLMAIGVICMMVLCDSIPSLSQMENSGPLVIEIRQNDCPVFEMPTRKKEAIISTVQPGKRFEVLEERQTIFSEPFYRIRYGPRHDVGWVYGAHVVTVSDNLIEQTTERSPAFRPEPREIPVSGRIKRLVEIYNEESAHLASRYNLRPFPVLSFDIEDSSPLLLRNKTINVPLTYKSKVRRLNFPAADKFIFQLIMTECFKDSGINAHRVVIEIHFGSDAVPVQLEYSYNDWLIHGRGSLDDFWDGIGGEEKNQLWDARSAPEPAPGVGQKPGV